MKFRYLFLLLFAILFIPMIDSAATTASTGVTFSWSYTSNAPACPTSGVLQNCFSGFTLTDTTTSTVLATPSTLGPGSTSYTWTPTTMFYGTHTFSLVANGYDGSGNALVSTAATVSVTNNVTILNPPTGLTGTLK